MTITIRQGDCRDVLPTLEAESVHCVVSSPPYWSLRRYEGLGDDQLGLEPRPFCPGVLIGEPGCGQCFCCHLVEVFALVWRVLRRDGTCFIVIGDSYTSGSSGDRNIGDPTNPRAGHMARWKARARPPVPGLPPKNLCLIPQRLAIALQMAGWWVRSWVVWHKPNGMVASVKDRPTVDHEPVLILTKQARYWWDYDAVKEPGSLNSHGGGTHHPGRYAIQSGRNDRGRALYEAKPAQASGGRNLRSVWTIPTQPLEIRGVHYAAFPPKLVETCLKAGCPEGGTVLDPFAGSGTVGLVADRLARDAVLIEASPQYVQLCRQRLTADAPLFNAYLEEAHHA